MSPLDHYEGKTIALYGADPGGIGAADALRQAGANILLWDERGIIREQLEKTPYRCTHPKNWPWDKVSTVFAAASALSRLSPNHPIMRQVASKEIAFATVADLFAECADHMRGKGNQLIAISGSLGKSVLASLISHILRAAGRKAVIAGEGPDQECRNLLSCLSLQQTAIIMEQPLPLMAASGNIPCDIAVVTNIFSHAVQREGLQTAMKGVLNLHKGLSSNGAYIVGVDGRITQGLCTTLLREGKKLHGEIIPVSGEATLGHGVFSIEGHAYAARAGKTSELGNYSRASHLQGAAQNELAAAAIAVCLKLGLQTPQIIKALHSFPGLSGRVEILARRDGLLAIDDSACSALEGVARIIGGLDHVHWIGHGGARGWGNLHKVKDNIAAIYLYAGDPDTEQMIADMGIHVQCFDSPAMAIAASYYDAERARVSYTPKTILFAPGCRTRQNASARQEFLTFVHRLKQAGVA
jgi:UDP-N-acetylmuramoylalanine--D-glutamate ligase